MMGACAGAASGAGIRFARLGTRGAGAPKSTVGLRTKPPRPAPWPPPRAKPGVDPTIQATANTATKTRFMIVFLLLLCLSYTRNLIIQRGMALLTLPGLDR